MIDIFLERQKGVLFRHINHLPDGALLEVGVGNGAHLQLYKKHQITGIDTSTEMLAIARKRCKGDIKLLEMDGEALLFDDGQFDYVILSHVIAVVDDLERLLKEVLRVLKPNGQLFILNHFTPDNWLRFIDHSFQRVSKLLHFRSVFHIHQIAAIESFDLINEVQFAPASYFKLLIYKKR